MAAKTKKPQTPPLVLSLLFTALLLLPAISASHPSNPDDDATDFIRISCSTTLYPDLCYSSLSRYATAVQQSPAQLARVSMAVSLSKARRITAYLSNLARQANSGVVDHGTVAVLHDCFSTMGDAIDQMRRSVKAMRHLNLNDGESFMFQMGDVQTWMSAALTNEDTCTDEFDDVPDGPTKSDVCNRVGNAKKFTSNALALINSFVAKEINGTVTP